MNITLETLAVILGLLYLLLAIKENPLCWIAAAMSSILFFFVFLHQYFFMSALLQTFYFAMAIYGWNEWGEFSEGQGAVQISKWSVSKHLVIIVVIVLCTIISGQLLSHFTHARAVYIDSFMTWASIITTYMVAKKILENWLYWIVLDSIACVFYFSQHLSMTALLFFVYTILAVVGFIRWRKTIMA